MINNEDNILLNDGISQTSDPCATDPNSELFVNPEISKDESQSISSEPLKDDTLMPSISSQLNPDIFDAEYDSDEDGTDLLPLPGSYSISDSNEDKSNFMSSKSEKKLRKDCTKSSRTKSDIKNRKDELMEIHSETQRLIRESRVQIPYHNPEKQGLSSVLDRIKHKRELLCISSIGKSFPKTKCTLLKASQSTTAHVLKSSSISSIKNKIPIPTKLNFDCHEKRTETALDFRKSATGVDEGAADCDETLMTRLKRRLNKMDEKDKEATDDRANDDAAKENERGERSGDLSEMNDHHNLNPKNSTGGFKGSLDECKDVVLIPDEAGHEFQAYLKDSLLPLPQQDAGKQNEAANTESQVKKSRIQSLVEQSVDPTKVPKLGFFQTEPSGVDKLFQRLEKELVNVPKKQQAVELRTASKQSIKDVETFEVKTVVYKMDEKIEVKKSSRDQLKEALQVQMMGSRQERLMERYEAYRKLGVDRGLVRLEEDVEEEGSNGSETPQSSSDDEGSQPDEIPEEEILDEEEEAVDRRRQENPFIDDEADEDEDDECAVEGDDDNDDGNEEEEEEEVEDGEIGPNKKRALKVIDDDDDDDDENDDDSDPKKQADEAKRVVNSFEEDAMSCHKIGNNPGDGSGIVPCRPFKEVGNDVKSRPIASFESFDLFQDSQEGNPSTLAFTRVENCSSSSSVREQSVSNLSNVPKAMASAEMSQSEDWALLMNPNENQSVSQVVKELCATQASQGGDLSMLCSGSFATQKEVSDVADDSEIHPTVKKSRKRKHDESDEEEEEDGDNAQLHNDEIDDEEKEEEEEEETEEKFLPLRSKGKINEEFVEEEAELSGSEVEEDDEEDAEDEMEMEEGDFDDVGTEEELRNQVNRVHMKTMIDQDKRQIRLLQEHLLEDGDLHDDGIGRMRRFRWSNLEDGTDDQEGRNESDDDGTKEEDVAWRMARLERERFLQQKQEKDEEEDCNNSQTPLVGKRKLKLVTSFQQESPLPDEHRSTTTKPFTPQATLPNLTPKFRGPKTVGSFLSRGKQALAKFSDSGKVGSSFGGGTSTMVSRNSRNFVFAHLSPSKSSANNEPKKENKTSQGGVPPRKKPHVDKEPPLPQSRILKYLND